jgi:drug/metabolite transporter (DMT)-like permease
MKWETSLTYVAYSLVSTAGLLLMKLGLQTLDLSWFPLIALRLSYKLLAGATLYILSFCLWLYIVRRSNIVFAYPIAVGLTQFWVMIGSMAILHTKFSWLVAAGAFFVVIGIGFLAAASRLAI